MVMIKGEIWWASLPNPRGSEPGKTRPVLVIQADSINRSAIQTVICAIITSNVALANAPGNILIEKSESKLDKTSVINFSQIITIDKEFLKEMVSMSPKHIINKINNSLKIIFDIE
jgi:mRNA interferase MazF